MLFLRLKHLKKLNLKIYCCFPFHSFALHPAVFKYIPCEHNEMHLCCKTDVLVFQTTHYAHLYFWAVFFFSSSKLHPINAHKMTFVSTSYWPSSQWANTVGSDTRSRYRSTPPLPPALRWHYSSVCDSTPNTALPLGLREPAGWPASTATAL